MSNPPTSNNTFSSNNFENRISRIEDTLANLINPPTSNIFICILFFCTGSKKSKYHHKVT